MSRIYKDFIYNKNSIQELIEICQKSTDVVGWYEHPYEDGNIRGPWHRWINVSKENEHTKDHIAKHSDEVKFIATAMNHFPHILNELLEKDKQIEILKTALVCMTFGRDQGLLIINNQNEQLDEKSRQVEILKTALEFYFSNGIVTSISGKALEEIKGKSDE